jgi:hypothetical protein
LIDPQNKGQNKKDSGSIPTFQPTLALLFMKMKVGMALTLNSWWHGF